MSTNFLHTASRVLLLLVLTGIWAFALILLVNFFLYLRALVEFFLELTQLG